MLRRRRRSRRRRRARSNSPRSVGHSAAIAGRSMPRHGPQVELGHRHQRAGIAGRDRDVGLALLDRVDGEPHRRLPAPLAQRLARLVVHPDGDVGVDELGSRLEPRTRRQQRLDHRAVAEQQKLGVGMTAERQLGARHDHRRAMVSPHGVERNANFLGHELTNTVVGHGPQQGATHPVASPPCPFLQRRQRGEWLYRIVSGRQRPGRPRPACADRGRSPRIRNSVAIAPRSTTPPISGSGPSSRVRRWLPRRRGRHGAAAAGREHKSIGFVDLVLDRLERDDAGLADGRARHGPTTRRPSRPCRVTSNTASRRGSARNPASLAMAARVRSSATSSTCRPVSDTSCSATGAVQGRSERRSRLGHCRHPAANAGTFSGQGKATCARPSAPASWAASLRTVSRT